MRQSAHEMAKRAMGFVIEVIGAHTPLAEVLPEEILTDDYQTKWLITVGYSRGPLAHIDGNREYKVVTIDDDTGQVETMRIRDQ